MELNLESLALTRVLALAHLALSGWALWVTRYPVITVFHGFLAVRPWPSGSAHCWPWRKGDTPFTQRREGGGITTGAWCIS